MTHSIRVLSGLLLAGLIAIGCNASSGASPSSQGFTASGGPTDPGGPAASGNPTGQPSTGTAGETPEPLASTGTAGGNSIYNEDIPATHAERIKISEIYMMREALGLLIDKGWDADSDKPLPLKSSDFNQTDLAAYIADDAHDLGAFTVPADLEPIYISTEAAADISAGLIAARNEFASFMSGKSVLPTYLDEFNNHVMPADPKRLIYNPINDPMTPAANVAPMTVNGEESFSELVLNVYPSDIYIMAQCLRRAKVLGEEPASGPEKAAYNKRLRDMGTRMVVYHEMTHALQHTYVIVHTPESQRTGRYTFLSAEKTLIDVDTQYHWLWGGHFPDLSNSHISDESQAEGIGFVALVSHYNMSARQQAAAWDHLFGRLDDSRIVLDECRSQFEGHFGGYAPSNFGSDLGPVMNDYPNSEGGYTLGNIAGRLTILPDIVGYLHPMLPQDTDKVWAALQRP
jgi:hypothetical protein